MLQARSRGVVVSRARLIPCLAALLLAALPAAAGAQAFQVAPFGSYRFGGDLYEVFTGTTLDIDGAPCVGVMADVFVKEGTSVSFLYSHQQARVELPGPWGSGPRFATLSIDHWHAGGTQELDGGVVRPFLSGSGGLTRFAGAQDSEMRFSLAGSAGVKLMPSDHLGARLEGRLYAVVVDGNLGRTVCGGFGCFIDVDVFLIWQMEFTAGLVVSF